MELLSEEYVHPLEFSSNLKYLTLKSEYKSIIKLPNQLIYLNLNGNFAHPIDSFHSSNLTHLIIGDEYNYPLDNLPQTLTYLVFTNYSKFSHPLNNLPISLIYLKFDYYVKFSHPFNNLPQSLKYLKLNDFNQPINNLPKSLIYLELDYEFNQPIDNLPQSLLYLILSNEFDQSINNLPNSLKYLNLLNSTNFSYTLDYLPK